MIISLRVLIAETRWTRHVKEKYLKFAYHTPKGTSEVCAHIRHIINVHAAFKIAKISSKNSPSDYPLFFEFWSYFQIWMSHMYIIAYRHSYDIIGQKSPIGQKFLPPRAPLRWRKNQYNLHKVAINLNIFRSVCKCCWFKARGVPEISVWSSIFVKWD